MRLIGIVMLAVTWWCLTLDMLPTARAVAPLGDKWQRGAVMPAFQRDTYGRATTAESLKALRATGSTHVSLYAEWYMPGLTASTISPDQKRTQTDRSLRQAMSTARSLGISPSLTIVVRPQGGWQGLIQPERTSKWFRQYRDMVRHYAELANRSGVQLVAIGAELQSMQRYTSHWKKVIDVARRHFDGELTYSANHIGGASSFAAWKRLDYIGISAYMPLSNGDPNPSVRELTRAWRKRGYVRKIANLKHRYHRPVLFTEVGYGSRMGTTTAPWRTSSGTISQAPQRRAYEAAYRVWSDVDWFRGIYWWYWPAGSYDPDGGGHTPRGKDAEGTMRAWNTARR